MSRSWSSAHDWKSCRGQKLLESSNLSNSARKKEPAAGRFFLFTCGEIRIYIEHASGMFIIQFSNWMIPLFFARCLLCPNATPSLAKNAGESLQLCHKSTLIMIESEYFSFAKSPSNIKFFSVLRPISDIPGPAFLLLYGYQMLLPEFGFVEL